MARREAINEVRPVLEELDRVAEVVDKGLDKAEQGVDIAAEAVEKGAHAVIEEAHQAASWVRNPRVAATVIIVANSVVWGFVGWRLAKRHYNKKFEAELEREITSARKFYSRLSRVDEDGEVATPEQATEEAAVEALKEYQNGPTQYNKAGAVDNLVAMVDDAVDAAATTSNSILVNGRAIDRDAFDLAEEVQHRNPNSPYVISKDEFMEGESGYVQTTVTYYAGDDTLADDRETAIDDVDGTVGVDNLSRFGHGSDDPNIVYVRNDRTEVDFEVALSPGKYSEEVHGFLEHSARPLPRKHKRGGHG